MNIEVLKTRIKEVSRGIPGIQLVYLFGSQVQGRTGPLSDVDVAFLADRACNYLEIMATFSNELGKKIKGIKVDVVSLNRAPIELCYAVISEGIPLFHRDLSARVDYEARILGIYGDLLPVLRAQKRDILKGDQHEARVERYRKTFGRTERALGQIRTAAG